MASLWAPGLLGRLLGEFVRGEMIFLAVGSGGGVGVGRQVVDFCCSIMDALWQWRSPGPLDAIWCECGLPDHLPRVLILISVKNGSDKTIDRS